MYQLIRFYNITDFSFWFYIFRLRLELLLIFVFDSFFSPQIRVVADLPVGENLQDHVMTNVDYFLQEPISITQYRAERLPVLMDYMLFGTGGSHWLKIAYSY